MNEPSQGFYLNSQVELLSWKIPGVSIMPHEVGYFVQSPLFSCLNASWIFKMYPYGRTRQSVGYIDITIERLHSKVKDHVLPIKIYYENAFKKEFILFFESERFHFESPKWTQLKTSRCMRNVKEYPERWQFLPNDTFTLIFDLSIPTDDSAKKRGRVIQIDSKKTATGVENTVSEKHEILDVGELIEDSIMLRYLYWKICGRLMKKPFQLPDDYQVQSESFNMFGASWRLKVCPYIWMKQSKKPNCDVILERLDSEIPEHHIGIRISGDGFPTPQVVSGFSIFNSQSTAGYMAGFQWSQDYISLVNCFHFKIEMWMKKNTGMELNSTKVIKPCGSGISVSESSVVLQQDIGILKNANLQKDVGIQRNAKLQKDVGIQKNANLQMDVDFRKNIDRQKNVVLQNFKKLYLQQEHCDVVFKVKGKELKAHRLVLKAQSPVLASAFRIDMKEKATGIINIEDCEPVIFSAFLCFLYCAEVSLSKDNVFGLYAVADKYDVSNLKAICMDYIRTNISVDTFCDTITLALLYSEAELVKLSTDFFAKYLQEIIVTVKWQSFLIENPIQGNELLIKALVPKPSQNNSQNKRIKLT